MNIKALITTLALVGSSSAAMADSVTFSGSVKVNLGGTTARPAPAPVYHAPVVVADDCNDNLPAPRPAYQPPARPPVIVHQTPVYRGPYYNPTNTIVGKDASSYKGSIAKSPTQYRRLGGKAIAWKGHMATTWFDLTEATRIDEGREFITIGADKGVFKALKLQGLGAGRSEIKQVYVEFLDGAGKTSYQLVKTNAWLGATSPITITLDGGYRQINRIVVYGSTDRGSAYKILAM